MLQHASIRTFKSKGSLAVDLWIEFHRQGRCQPGQPCQKARFVGMISSGPSLPGGDTSFISVMSFP